MARERCEIWQDSIRILCTYSAHAFYPINLDQLAVNL